MIKTGILIAVLATTGGAATFTAQNSVEGDVLYPVKTYVDESVDTHFGLKASGGADAETQTKTYIEADSQVTAQSQIDTLMNLVGEAAAELRLEGQTSAGGNTEKPANSDTEASSEVDVNLESNVKVETDDLNLESSGALEGNSGVRLGL